MFQSINEFVSLLIESFDDPILILNDRGEQVFNNKKFIDFDSVETIKKINKNLEKETFFLNETYSVYIQKTNIDDLSHIAYFYKNNTNFNPIQINDLLNLISEIPLGLLIYDFENGDFKLSYYNEKILSILGKEDISSIHFFNNLKINGIDDVSINNFDLISNMIKTKENSMNNLVYLYNENGKNCYSINLIVNKRNNNQIRNIIISFKEMNEIIELKKHAELNEFYYKNLLEKSTDGISIIQDYKIIYFNDSLADMLKCNQSDLVNHNFLHYLSRNHIKEFKNLHDARMNGDDSTKNLEFTLIDINGKYVYCIGSFSLITINGKNASLGFIKDITELKMKEKELLKYQYQLEDLVQERTRELEESKLEYELIANESPIGIIKVDKNGKINYLNEKSLKLFGKINNIFDVINEIDRQDLLYLELNNETQFDVCISNPKLNYFKAKMKKINDKNIIITLFDNNKEKILIPSLLQLKGEFSQEKGT